jgi:ribosomal protein S18 acetylase RimI-like enzyme
MRDECGAGVTVAAGGQLSVTVRPATAADLRGIVGIFGRAFDDYRRGLGLGPEALGCVWRSSLAARLEATRVAETADGRLAGFVVFVRPGETERYGSRREARDRLRVWGRVLGLRAFWRLPAFFIPMALAYARRHARKDEVYVSLVAVDPPCQGRGVGQALLAAVEEEARAAGASAILLHTASTNTRARAAYARAGYELVCTVRAPWLGPARIPAFLALRKPLRPDPTPTLDRLDRASPAGEADAG